MKSQTIQESRWVGRVLREKWRIDGKIARGGMGTVYFATHKNNGSRAAIKVLHPEFSRDEDTRSRFLQEGYAANQVGHPGVVRILDDDTSEDGHAYLVMELLEGELLEQRRIRKGGRLPIAEVYEIGDQLLDVLAAAHAKGIVHRDIKPDNIFLTKSGRLKVLDFGFAQMKSGYRREQTATGFLLGTPGFMAPEQATGNRPLIDAQTDIWAAGATLFQLITGEPVHPGDSPAEMLVAAANFQVRSVTTIDPRLPTKLSFAIDRALAFEKKERWPDAKSMQAALRAVPGRQGVAGGVRQSIPDDERLFTKNKKPVRRAPALAPGEVAEEATVMENIEELTVEDEIEPEAADYQDPTVARRSPLDRAPLSKPPALPKDDGPTMPGPQTQRDDGPTITRPSPQDDGPTIARSSPGEDPTIARPSPNSDKQAMTERLPSLTPETATYGSFHSSSDEIPAGESTLIMQTRPSYPDVGQSTPRPAAGMPAGSGRTGTLPPAPLQRPPQQSYPDAYPHPQSLPVPTPQPPPSNPHVSRHPSQPYFQPMAHGQMPGPSMAPRPAVKQSKALVFVLVAGITAVVVILTGLLIILGSD